VNDTTNFFDQEDCVAREVFCRRCRKAGASTAATIIDHWAAPYPNRWANCSRTSAVWLARTERWSKSAWTLLIKAWIDDASETDQCQKHFGVVADSWSQQWSQFMDQINPGSLK